MLSLANFVNTYFCAFLRGTEGKREEVDIPGMFFQLSNIVLNYNLLTSISGVPIMCQIQAQIFYYGRGALITALIPRHLLFSAHS